MNYLTHCPLGRAAGNVIENVVGKLEPLVIGG